MKNSQIKKEEFTFFPRINDKLTYLFAFAFGLIVLTLGSFLFMLPVIFLTGSYKGGNIEEINTNIMNTIVNYQGFISLLPELVAIFLCIWILKKMFIQDGKNLIKDWLRNLIIIAISTIFIIGLGHLFDLIYTQSSINPDSENQKIIEEILAGKGRFSMILQVAIVAPIFEELVFRKFTFGFLDYTKLHSITNIGIVALLFALIHCLGEDFRLSVTYLYLLNYLSLSLVLTLAYYFSKKNIYISIIVHMINNIISLCALCGVLNGII